MYYAGSHALPVHLLATIVTAPHSRRASHLHPRSSATKDGLPLIHKIEQLMKSSPLYGPPPRKIYTYLNINLNKLWH
jgi:hypothetical protein